MLIGTKEILAIAEDRKCAIPAFNVYNMENAIGVMEAAEALKAPVIFQMYSRLFDSDEGMLLAPTIIKCASELSVPAAVHLDHGASTQVVLRALRAGLTGIMRDASTLTFDENINITKQIVELCGYCGVGVEAELGHVGTTKEEINESQFTEVADAEKFVSETGVSALAVAIGTAHGKYKKAPILAIKRISDLHAALDTPLVMHGGSGVPDDQVKAAINAGIRKTNYATDLCYTFLDSINSVSRDIVAVDKYMQDPIMKVREFAMNRIQLVGAQTV